MLDADWVERLGCTCLLNMPIVNDGAVVGTFNIGASENRFVGAELDYLETLLTLIGPSLSLARSRSQEEAAPARCGSLETTET